MQTSFAKYVIMAGIFFLPFFSKAQLVVSNQAPYNTAQFLVQNVLLGTGIQAFNFVYTGAPVAVGYFNGMASNIGLDSGIILCSGHIDSARGPNVTGFATVVNNTPGDAQLEQITGNTANGSFDAAVLQFDFIPMADTVKFDYVFGSEEYMEWVNSSFNDAFAFILSGVTTPLAPVNIARIPSPPAPPNTPVTINNVNANSYPQFYVNNEVPPGQTVNYDGFTVPLRAQYPVICGQTYRIKIVVADIGDAAYDSGVFLKAGSFSASSITITSNISYGGPNDSTLFEGCGQACLVFDRGSANIGNPDTVQLTFGGTAINGVDFTTIPNPIIFQPGQDSIVICIQAFSDAITEGIEILTISAQTTGPCSQTATNITIYIGDLTPLVLTASNDTTICPGGTITLNANTTGGVQPYSYVWSTGATTSSITFTPSATTTYSVAVSDSCSSPVQSQSIVVTVLPPGPVVVSLSDITVCEGNTVSLVPGVSGGAPNYVYAWTTTAGPDQVPNPNSPNNTFLPTTTGSFQLTVTDRCGVVGTGIANVVVDNQCQLGFPNVFTPNADGLNDFFSFENLDKYPNSRLQIFNRWGSLLLDDPDYKNNWNGAKQPDGTYYYILYVSDGRVFPGYFQILGSN
jgi:gliding motility-associated-like protein